MYTHSHGHFPHHLLSLFFGGPLAATKHVVLEHGPNHANFMKQPFFSTAMHVHTIQALPKLCCKSMQATCCHAHCTASS